MHTYKAFVLKRREEKKKKKTLKKMKAKVHCVGVKKSYVSIHTIATFCTGEVYSTTCNINPLGIHTRTKNSMKKKCNPQVHAAKMNKSF
mmetsp:Transcript_45968/g.55332  ORF Transcript_45968/g.55332 Transcript_45968/m.55332 type:complete len:89 (-) Transcript_45968:472-738(-)